MIGTTFGNFRVVERIGDGGMGAVYRAVDEMLDREVAIKVLRPELSRNTALIERFRQEAKALARLNHPRIATLHGLEKHGESLLMIMEYVRGDTFEALVQRSGRLSWTRAAELCAATLDALDHAHDKGVVHRDIKPANIMLGAGGGVKVMDFGIARLVGKNRQTQVGHAVGTPTYMAPEQLRGEEVDGRTDLYATGAVLFELTTGHMAFEADSDYGLMMKQLNEPPPPTSLHVPGVPPVLDALIARAMAKRIDDRFRSAADFRDALLEAVAAHGGAMRKSTPVPAETRLATPTPVPLGAPTGESRAAHARSATPAETRLAPPAHGMAPETRLASPYSDGIAATRLAEPIAPAPTRLVNADVSRLRDWRVVAAAGGLFAAAGIAVMMMRAPAVPDTRVADSLAAVAAADSAAMQSPVVGAAGDIDVGRENASSLIISRPAPPAPPAGGGSGGSGGSGDGAGDAGKSPPPASKPAPSPAKPKESASARRESVETKAPTPAPVVAPVSSEGSEADAQSRILAALEAAASELSGRNTGAASLLDGSVRDAWADLMKEGRVSLRVSGAPEIQRGGGRATAEFSGSVNVRSPFGANKRRNARFSAELERRGGGWHVTRLRALEALELK